MDTPTNTAAMEDQRLHIPDVPDAQIEKIHSIAADRLEKALLDTGALPRFAAKALLCIQDAIIDDTADPECELLAACWLALEDPREAGYALQKLMRAEIDKYAGANYCELIQPLELWEGEE